MEYIAGTTEFQLYNSAVCLGKFDGLHLGHQLLMDTIISLKSKGYSATVFSFIYNPSNLFSDNDLKVINTEEEKRKKLEQKGIDVFISYPFSQETSSMEPVEFIEEVLVKRMDAKVIVVGQDFCFGHKRKGNVELLEELSKIYGYELIVYDKVKLDGDIVSSSRIREELLNGNISMANELLGTPYSIVGQVLHGKKIGRTIGMPTVNLIPDENKILPPNGVYASKVIVDDKEYLGVSNIGTKPSVGDHFQRGVETYLFDMNQDMYGKTIEVKLYEYERPELKFETIEELSECMHNDILWAKEYFKNHEY